MKRQLDIDTTIYDGFLFEALAQIVEKQQEALDLAIDALKGDLHCPKCGTIVRDGRQYHDLVYRGEAEPTVSKTEKVADDDYCSNGEKKQVTGNQKSVETSTDKADKSTVGQPKSKLKNPCDSLLKADSDECKEHKSKLDCISREQAVEAVTNTIREKFSLADWYEQLVETGLEIESLIKELPPVTPTERTGWIPVSERLPKEKQEVYVTVYFTEGDTGRAYGYIDGFGKWHLYSTVEGTLNSGYEVTAWRPLPEPYKAESEEV